MAKLTIDEINLLRHLEAQGGEGTMSGIKDHRPLNRLVEWKHVSRTRVSGTLDTSTYKLTAEGRAALKLKP